MSSVFRNPYQKENIMVETVSQVKDIDIEYYHEPVIPDFASV